MTTRTEGQASLLLQRYEEKNRDLPKSTRIQMAPFALVHRTGIDALEALFGRKLGQTPYRHRSWFWWTAMRTSGLAKEWDPFTEMRNQGVPFDECLRWLKERASDDQWDTLSRRLGKENLYPGDYSHKPRDTPDNIWTKGGTWQRESGFTKIILLGESLDRDYTYNDMTLTLGPEGALKLERELRGLVDPDKELEPNAKWSAVRYVRRRLPSVAGWRKTPTAHPRTVSWFFQEEIPESEGSPYFYDWRWPISQRRKLKNGRARYWAWLPGETDE